MSEYKFFATVYDRMMDNIPYDFWEQYLLQILYRNNVSPVASITEIGCGTGTMTERLADYGFHMTGIDLSEDMLKEAREKQRVRLRENCDSEKRVITRQDSEKIDMKWQDSEKQNVGQHDNQNNQEIPYIQMDMRELNLPEKQDVIISVCDSMNYLLTNDDLYRTMKSVRENLKDDGLFIFDLKTEYFFVTQLDGYSYKEKLKDFSYVWTNRYDMENHIHTYYLKFKLFEEGKRRKVIKTEEEVHRQRAFFASDIKEAALKAGFNSAKVYDAGSFDRPRVNSERIYVVLKKD